MKKIILQNSNMYYKVQYIISKRKYAIYVRELLYKGYTNRNIIRGLSFIKNNEEHRLCNIGPSYKSEHIYIYKENNKLHNLYGYAMINRHIAEKQYNIYGVKYNKYQFDKYISIYNKLSYKRTY